MFWHQTFRLVLDWRGSERSILRRKVARAPARSCRSLLPGCVACSPGIFRLSPRRRAQAETGSGQAHHPRHGTAWHRCATVMGRRFGYAGVRCRVLHHMPDHLFCNAIAPDRTPSADTAEHSSFGGRRRRQPAIDRSLDTIGHGDGTEVGGLAQIHNGPMFVSLLQVVKVQAGRFPSAQSTAEQEGKNRTTHPQSAAVILSVS